MAVILSLTDETSGASVSLSFERDKAMAAVERFAEIRGIAEEGDAFAVKAEAVLREWVQNSARIIKRYEVDARRATLETDIDAEYGFEETA